MKIPELSRRAMSRAVLTQFGGINRTPGITEGEWADAENLSSDRFPALTMREAYQFYNRTDADGTAGVPLLAYNDGLVELIPDSDSNKYDHLYYNHHEIVPEKNGDTYKHRGYHDYMTINQKTSGLSRFASDDPRPKRQAVCFGSKVIFMPYKTYFDTATVENIDDTTCTADVGTLYKKRYFGNIKVFPVFEDGNYIKTVRRRSGSYYYNYNDDLPTSFTSRELVCFQKADGTSGADDVEYNIYQNAPGTIWELQTKIRYKMIYRGGASGSGNKYPPVNDGLYEGDRITVNMTYPDDGGDWPFNGEFTINEVGDGYIVFSNNSLDSNAFFKFFTEKCSIASMSSEAETSAGCTMSLISISREVPEMSYMCANNNRLFGCSPDGHTIYASYLGDPFNWTNYESTSMASYFATVATPGPFTGCIAWEDRVVFFKENYIHVLSGSYPATFTLSDIATPGPAQSESVSDGLPFAVVSGIVYYGTKDGVYRWSGGYAQKVSQALGEGEYCPRDAFAVRDKFYIFMQAPGDKAERLYVYDTLRGVWQVESGGLLETAYGHCVAEGGAIISPNQLKSGVSNYLAIGVKTENPPETGVSWYAESGVLGASEPDRRYVGKIQITADVPAGGELHVQLQYNGDGLWRDYFSYAPQRRATQLFPIIPRRCDNVRLRLHGSGDVVIYNISYYYERASEYGNNKY